MKNEPWFAAWREYRDANRAYWALLEDALNSGDSAKYKAAKALEIDVLRLRDRFREQWGASHPE